MKNKIIGISVYDARLGIDAILDEEGLDFNQKLLDLSQRLKELILEHSITKEDESYRFEGQRNKPDESLEVYISKERNKWVATIHKGVDPRGLTFDSNRFKFLLKRRLYDKFKKYILDNYDLSKEGELRMKTEYTKEISSKPHLKVV